jgi:MFS family permease
LTTLVPAPISDRRSPADLLLVAGLLVLTALPDAMVVPLLEELLVTRYGVGPGAAHAFLSVNLIGGLCAVPLLGLAARWRRPILAVAVASIADAGLLGAMWLPIGFAPTIVLRGLEGVADVMVFAVVFDLVGHLGRRRGVGLRFGFAAALLSVALGSGAILGGVIARLEGGDQAARIVYLVGAGACLTAGVLAWIARDRLRRIEGVETEVDPAPASSARSTHAPFWPLLLIAGSDRAAGGLLTGTLGLFLAEAIGLGPAIRGMLVGSVLLLMGFGAVPAGWLADRFGDLRTRFIGAVAFAVGIALLPLAAAGLPLLVIDALVIGLGGAVLLPTSLSMLDRLHGGLVGMGGFRAAGDVGFLIGVVSAGLLVERLVGGSGGADVTSAYAAVFAGFGGVHLAITAIALPALVAADRRSAGRART